MCLSDGVGDVHSTGNEILASGLVRGWVSITMTVFIKMDRPLWPKEGPWSFAWRVYCCPVAIEMAQLSGIHLDVLNGTHSAALTGCKTFKTAERLKSPL